MGKLRKQTADAVGGETRHDVFNGKVLDLAQELLSEGRVEEGMRELMAALWAEKLKGSQAEWKGVVQQCLQHPLRDLLHEDPFTRRAYRKPRGYPGDAVLLDYIYGREERWSIPEGTSELGHKIFEYTTRTTACEGVRARRGYIADLLDELAQKVNRPHVLAIAAGHLREAILCAAVKRRRLGRYVALDADRESMAEIERCYGAFGVETVHASIRDVITHKRDLGRFHLIYSTGLYDYLQQTSGQRLTATLFEMLAGGGRLLVANFLPGIPGVGYMESYMDWKLVYRTRREILDLAAEIPQAQLHEVKIFAEENRNIIFLELMKG